MRIAIRHELTVTPAPGAHHCVLQVLLTPQAGPTQSVQRWRIDMAGIETAGQFGDAFGNRVHLVNQQRPEGPIGVTVEGVVETTDRHGVLGRPGGEPVPALFKRITDATRIDPALADPFRNRAQSRLDTLHALMGAVHAERGPAPMQRQSQDGQTQMQSSGAAVTAAAPSATEATHRFIGLARALDIPARFVTGYLLDEGDAAPLHTWAEAFDEGLGWIGFDPVLNLCPTERHVRLAVGLDAVGTQPLRCVPVVDGPETVGVRVEAAEG